MDRLKGKTAVVVGAGSIGPGWGNGKATAVTFAREGATVFCVDRNGAAAEETVNIITGEGGKAAAFTADVSRAVEVEYSERSALIFVAGSRSLKNWSASLMAATPSGPK